MAYATPLELLERKDARDIGDLVSDTETPVSPADLPSNTNLLAALDDASGDIEAALLVGGKYTTDDLDGLTGNSRYHLVRITIEVAMYHLLRRRPEANLDQLEYYSKLRDSYIEPLRGGSNVFNIPAHLAAGKADVSGPTTQQYNDLNLVRDRVRNYFPRRFNPDNR